MSHVDEDPILGVQNHTRNPANRHIVHCYRSISRFPISFRPASGNVLVLIFRTKSTFFCLNFSPGVCGDPFGRLRDERFLSALRGVMHDTSSGLCLGFCSPPEFVRASLMTACCSLRRGARGCMVTCALKSKRYHQEQAKYVRTGRPCVTTMNEHETTTEYYVQDAREFSMCIA